MPEKVFFCYAREDEPLLNKLKTHLRPLERAGLVEMWHDRDIRAGSEWEKEIDRHLSQAQIILLLISPDFMDSEYCYSIEMKKAMERHGRRETKVIPVILRSAYWQIAPLNRLQALPQDGIPIVSSTRHNQDEAFFEVIEGIRETIETPREKPHARPAARLNHSSRTSSYKTQNDRHATTRTTQTGQIEVNSPAIQPSQQISTDTSATLDQAYETLRTQIEKDAGYSGALVVRTTNDRIGDVVHIQRESWYKAGGYGSSSIEHASVRPYALNGFSLAAAVFKRVGHDYYVVWANKSQPRSIIICAGEATLVDLSMPPNIGTQDTVKKTLQRRNPGLKLLGFCSVFTALGYIVGITTGFGLSLYIGFLIGLLLWGTSSLF